MADSSLFGYFLEGIDQTTSNLSLLAPQTVAEAANMILQLRMEAFNVTED